jgi:hypothetical protein
MNKVNKIYDDTEWRPSFYYVSQPTSHPEGPHKGDRDHIKDNIELGIPCFLRSDYSKYTGENVYKLNVLNLHGVDLFDDISNDRIPEINLDILKEFWSDDPTKLIYHYHTMYGVLQMAKFMGFDEIYLIGCDLGFKYFDPHMIFNSGMDPIRYARREQGYTPFSYLREATARGNPFRSLINGIAAAALKDPYISKRLSIFKSNSDSYFSSDYTERFRIHDGPLVDEEITKSHLVTQRICSDDGIDVYNATIGGELEVYPRKNLSDIL